MAYLCKGMRCASFVQSAESFCEKHKGTENSRYYRKRKSLGICQTCLHPSSPGKISCQSCATALASRAKMARLSK